MMDMQTTKSQSSDVCIMRLKRRFQQISASLSLFSRKPAFRICENKEADQLRGIAKLISACVFATRIVRSLYFLNPKFQAYRQLPWLVRDMFRDPEDCFSHNEADFMVIIYFLPHIEPI